MISASGLPRSGRLFARFEGRFPPSTGTGGAAASSGCWDRLGARTGSTAAATVANIAQALNINRMGRCMVRIRPWLPGSSFPRYTETYKVIGQGSLTRGEYPLKDIRSVVRKSRAFTPDQGNVPRVRPTAK